MLQADTIIPDGPVTQSMNRYAYVFNNPLSYTDPTGHSPVALPSIVVTPLVNVVDQEKLDDFLRNLKTTFFRDYVMSSGGVQNAAFTGSNTSNSFMIELGKKDLKYCEGNGGCPDWFIKVSKERAFGEIQYPSDSILLPESPDDFGVRVRISSSTGLIYWETPTGEVSVQGIKEFGEQGVKNGVIFVALSSLGMIGRTGNSTGIKIPNNQLLRPPAKKGNAPIGSDKYPVELHHRNQTHKGPLDEMTQSAHRRGANFKKNHPNTGQSPTKIDRKRANKEREDYWNAEWDSGRFNDM